MTEFQLDCFADGHKLQDEVWGQISLNNLEKDVIGTPEFLRLFRTYQLGFARLVYQTANHTRGTHSIGACHVATLLMDSLTENTRRYCSKHKKYASIEISPAERVLIRLGALLHDISHGPLSHDIEKKTHKIFYQDKYSTDSLKGLSLDSHYGPYSKHDDYKNNPLLYRLIFDDKNSVLARVLIRYSKRFYQLFRDNDSSPSYDHLKQFLSLLSKAKKKAWSPEQKLLPELLFHLLTYEDPDMSNEFERTIAIGFDKNNQIITSKWGVGPEFLRKELHRSWYQPFRHDIIGNTLSADLIEYLTRDALRLGTKRQIDLHLLNYYVLVDEDQNKNLQQNTKNNKITQPYEKHPSNPRFRCAIDLWDHKRGTSRVSVINDIFRLLDLRHEIHEKAVMHRIVQAANAMLSRALLLMRNRKPFLANIVNLEDVCLALQGEDNFLLSLIERCSDEVNTNDSNRASSSERIKDAQNILLKLIDRRIYRPLMIIPGDRAANHFKFSGMTENQKNSNEYRLRTLATLVDSTYYSPFFLFVSECIEKYLQGVFDSTKSFCKYAEDMVSESDTPELTSRAMNLAPSRVIIWTTPYKQLYKDPAIVVSLEGWVGQIDKILTDNNFSSERHSSVLERARSSIREADSKYATLWKLYVFVSDGLFYTGLLNKLSKSIPESNNQHRSIERHTSCLKEAQALLISALDAVQNNWSELCEVNHSVPTRQQHLKQRIDVTGFRLLVKRWISMYCDTQHFRGDPARGLSIVDVNSYVHDDPLLGPQGLNCRDIRYKYDSDATELWFYAKKDKNSPEHELVMLLENFGIRDPSAINKLEFVQLAEFFKDSDIKDRCRQLLNEFKVRSPTKSDLKLLFVSGFPWPDADVRKEKAVPIEGVPFTQSEIREWLLKEIVSLTPRVRNQLARDINEIIDVIWSIPDKLHPAVFEDLQLRFRNEMQLINDDIKSEQIVYALKQKWQKNDRLNKTGS